MYMPSNNFMDQVGGNNDSFAKVCILPETFAQISDVASGPLFRTEKSEVFHTLWIIWLCSMISCCMVFASEICWPPGVKIN